MPDCRTFRDDLAAYLDRELGQSRRLEVVRHLEACPACREEASRLERSWEELSLAAPAAPSAGFRARFWERERASQAPLWPVLARALAGLTGAWALGVAAGLALHLRYSPPASPQLDRGLAPGLAHSYLRRTRS